MNAPSSPPTAARPSPRYRTPPGPRSAFWLANVRAMRRDRLEFVQALQRTYGDVVRYRVAFWTLYQVSHPDHVRHVLQDNHRNYTKGAVLTNLLAPVLGNGLFTSEGDFWLRQRRLMQPVFHRKRIAAFGTIMTDVTTRRLERWQACAERGQPLDIAAEMMRLTLVVATRSLFGADVSAQVDVVDRAFTAASEHLTYKFDIPFYPPASIPTPRNRRFRASLQALDRVVYGLIDERLRRNDESGDLLSMLLQVRDAETGEGMSRAQLRDEVMTLLLAGHETTANALTWSWYLLSQHPEAERRLQTEVATVVGGRLPTVDDLPHLPYTRMVFEEALRLYPPVWITQRQAIAEDEIGGYHIPAGATIALSPWVTHRRPDIWPDPMRFEPERFTEERVAERLRGAYIPFGSGPRQCIGQSFAMVEGQLVLATIAQQFRLQLVPGRTVEPEARLTLRPHGGLPMILQRV